jgi:high-affinity iron transporter
MLATFVIGLREGLEAALIVGIIAAYLRQRGRRDLLNRVWWGTGLAVALCTAVAIGLQILSANLPQQQQEMLETVVGAAAVVMVTSMIVWMQKHARTLKGQLEAAAAEALASSSGWALVVMAFLAVLREGMETAVFLLATFQASENVALASGGAIVGVLVAAVVGVGLYRGAIQINLGKFFQVTSLVLVLVAAGLVLTSLHTAHEAGWINVWQKQILNLSWLIQGGSVQAAVLTGMLGLQARPTQIEVTGWLLYVLAVGGFVAWPRSRSSRPSAPISATTVGAH